MFDYFAVRTKPGDALTAPHIGIKIIINFLIISY